MECGYEGSGQEVLAGSVHGDDRRKKVDREIKRPTFMLRTKPLNVICGFLPLSTLMENVEGIRKLGIARSLSLELLKTTPEYFEVRGRS